MRCRVSGSDGGPVWQGERSCPLLTVTAATSADLDEVLALLQTGGLSGNGVAEGLSGFLVAREGGRLVAVAGLEDHGPAGLLRSVAVAPDRRARLGPVPGTGVRQVHGHGPGARPLICGCTSHADAVDHEGARTTSAALEALADPIRLGIVQLLSRHDRMCVCEIAEAFPVEQPTISHHLRLLREAGVVDAVRRGQWAFYGLRREALKRMAQDLVALL